MAGDIEQVERLLAEGADIDAADAVGTPLLWAIMSGRSNTILLLLTRGADPNLSGPLGSPLYFATVKDNESAVDHLLKNGADPGGTTRAGRPTPLHEATRRRHVAIVGLLLEAGADPMAVTADEDTPLHYAAKAGVMDNLRRLIDHGADVNALNGGGQPPLHFAIVNEHKDLAEYLIAHGAGPPQVENIDGLILQADLGNGKAVIGLCTTCHHLESNKKLIGPGLWNVVNRSKAGLQDFTYSPAMSTLQGDWTYQDLNTFLAHPAWTVPGTSMEHSGISTPKDRADLIGYLRTLSDSLEPLPKAE